MGQVRKIGWNWAAGLALMALFLQSFGPLAKGVDSHYRKSLMAALTEQGLAASICRTPSASAVTDSKSMTPGGTDALVLMSAEERASLAKKLRCPCVFGSHSCAYCVTYCFNVLALCLLALGMAWLLRRREKECLYPPLREVAVRMVFRLSLSPRAPPFSLA